MVKLVITTKVEKRPGSADTMLYKYDLYDVPIKGGQQWELFIYGPRYDGVVYQKIYIDVENKKLIGKQNELAPWKELSPIQTVERVIL